MTSLRQSIIMHCSFDVIQKKSMLQRTKRYGANKLVKVLSKMLQRFFFLLHLSKLLLAKKLIKLCAPNVQCASTHWALNCAFFFLSWGSYIELVNKLHFGLATIQPPWCLKCFRRQLSEVLSEIAVNAFSSSRDIKVRDREEQYCLT